MSHQAYLGTVQLTKHVVWTTFLCHHSLIGKKVRQIPRYTVESGDLDTMVANL